MMMTAAAHRSRRRRPPRGRRDGAGADAGRRRAVRSHLPALEGRRLSVAAARRHARPRRAGAAWCASASRSRPSADVGKDVDAFLGELGDARAAGLMSSELSVATPRAHGPRSEELHLRSKRERFPISGGIELTHRCNLACIHCYVNLPAERSRRAGARADDRRVVPRARPVRRRRRPVADAHRRRAAVAPRLLRDLRVRARQGPGADRLHQRHHDHRAPSRAVAPLPAARARDHAVRLDARDLRQGHRRGRALRSLPARPRSACATPASP